MSTNDLKADSLLKDYFSNVRYFTDMINVVICGGKQVITPENVSDYDSNASTFYDDNQTLSIDRDRDIIKKITIGQDEILIGIENQGQEKWNMPFRAFQYNALNQFRQWHHLKNGVERKKHPPIKSISLILYFGDKKWKGPRTYDESVKKVPKVFEDIARYNMFPITDIKTLDHHLFKEKDNRDLVKGLKMLYGWNEDLSVFEGFIVSKNVALIIASLAKDKELVKVITEQIEEEVNMCESIRVYREKVLREGELSGIIKGKKLGMEAGEKFGIEKGKRLGIKTRTFIKRNKEEDT